MDIHHGGRRQDKTKLSKCMTRCTNQSIKEDYITYMYLLDQDVNFENCRGQTYDNVSNMSGNYTGMQRILKNKNSIMDYIPCAEFVAAHTNLKVGEYPRVRSMSVTEMPQMLWKGCRASNSLKTTPFMSS